MGTPAETLRQARDLIADQKHWTTRSSARDAMGDPVYVHAPAAASFCTLGAVDRILGTSPSATPLFGEAMEFIYQVIPNNQSVSSFNDSHTHEEVLALFDAAIAKAEEVEA